eukprot:7326542-Prymnesium_polylepis.1
MEAEVEDQRRRVHDAAHHEVPRAEANGVHHRAAHEREYARRARQDGADERHVALRVVRGLEVVRAADADHDGGREHEHGHLPKRLRHKGHLHGDP